MSKTIISIERHFPNSDNPKNNNFTSDYISKKEGKCYKCYKFIERHAANYIKFDNQGHLVNFCSKECRNSFASIDRAIALKLI